MFVRINALKNVCKGYYKKNADLFSCGKEACGAPGGRSFPEEKSLFSEA